MSLAKFAPLHGGLLARKGKAMPATGEVNAESRKDDPEALLNGREHSFDTELPTPESGSHEEKEIPAEIAATPETEDRIPEAEDAQPAPLIVEPEVAIERRQLDLVPEQSERHAGEPWDGVDRRTVDRGLLAGVPERRRPPVFGKRGTTRASLSETSQKRFNA